MKVLDVQTLGDCYASLVEECIDTGERLSPRGKACLELRPVVLRTRRHGRLADAGVSYRLSTAEAMAYLAGWDDVGWLTRFNPKMADFSDDGKTFFGAYGRRMRDELGCVIERLRFDNDTRQAVLSIWEKKDNTATTKDFPCNTQLLMKVRRGELDLSVVVRSQDLVWGLPYDHDAWWLFLKAVAPLVGARPGYLTQFIDSLHVYEPSAGFYEADRVAKARSARPSGVVRTPWNFAATGLSALRAELEHVRALVEAGSRNVDPLADYLEGS